jgi:UDP-2-acetamido-2-deoxy-ribo-hexuluronate aminotransferase
MTAFIDLAAQQRRIRPEIDRRIGAVLDHGRYIMGPEVAELEGKLADYCGTSRCIGCGSGTDALLMALMAYDVGPGRVVFTTPFTFVATAEMIQLLGATPVFVDVDETTFNLDPAALDRAVVRMTETRPDLRSVGIIAVDLFGLPADYDAIREVARKSGLFVIEDAAQSFGATYNGRRAGSLGDVACTSFFPAKPLGGYGDGGAVLTDNPELADKMVSIRVHGQGSDKYENVRTGINGRLDTLQAAVLLAKLEIFDEELKSRRAAADRYTAGIRAAGINVTPPTVTEGRQSAWAQYSVLVESRAIRDRIRERLGADGVPTAIYYPKPLHLQRAFAGLGCRPGDFPVSESLSERIFSLPMHPYLTPEDQDRIIERLAAAAGEG